MARRRKNATFTLDQTYGAGDGERTLVQAFYDVLDELYPGDTPLPLPNPANVHPTLDVVKQVEVFANFILKKLIPLALTVKNNPDAHKESLAVYARMPRITKSNAEDVGYVQSPIGDWITSPTPLEKQLWKIADSTVGAVAYGNNNLYVATSAASVASMAVKAVDADVVWSTVNTMLELICGNANQAAAPKQAASPTPKQASVPTPKQASVPTPKQARVQEDAVAKRHASPFVVAFHRGLIDRARTQSLGVVPTMPSVDVDLDAQGFYWPLADYVLRYILPVILRGSALRQFVKDCARLPKYTEKRDFLDDVRDLASDMDSAVSDMDTPPPFWRSLARFLEMVAIEPTSVDMSAVIDLIGYAAALDPDATWKATTDLFRVWNKPRLAYTGVTKRPERFMLNVVYGTRVDDRGNTSLRSSFYAGLKQISELHSILIPPESNVHVQHTFGLQAGMMFDLIIGAVLPLFYDAYGATRSANMLRALPMIEGPTDAAVLQAALRFGNTSPNSPVFVNALADFPPMSALTEATNTLKQVHADARDEVRDYFHRDLRTGNRQATTDYQSVMKQFEQIQKYILEDVSAAIVRFRTDLTRNVALSHRLAVAMAARNKSEVLANVKPFEQRLSAIGEETGHFAAMVIKTILDLQLPSMQIRAGDDAGKNFDDVLWDLVNQTLEQL